MTADKTVKALEVPRLVVQLADGKEVHHHLAGTEMTIGRDPSNKICLTDHFVSKFHAKLVKSAGPEPAWVLTDLGSANKTYVNGEPITEATVRFGDAIRFASVDCRLVAPEVADGAKAAGARPAPAAREVPSPASAAQPPPPPAPAVPRPKPQAPAARPPAPPPRPSARPTPAPNLRAGSSAPRIEADPMKRLLTIGAILILISLVLGIFLRILLVPSETPPAEADSRTGTETGTPSSGASVTPGPTEPAVPATGSGASTGQAAGGAATSGPRVDASGNRTAEFYFEEGLSYLDTGRLKDAQTSLRKVIELDPDHTRAKTRLSLLDEEIEKQAQVHFDNAREAFQFLRYDEAIAEWEMFLLIADPGDVRYAEAQQGIEQAQSRLR